jgi:serine/threonine protein kinase
MTDSLNTLPVGTKLQEFVVDQLIGIGGFGIVYRADDTLLHRKVAIKEYMPTSMASRADGATVSVRSEAYTVDFETGKRGFIKEARMLARFKHPALIEVFRFWEQNSTAYMATPFYEGQTLKQRLASDREKIVNEAYLMRMLTPILDALDQMHKEHIYHRDISPDNIMIISGDRPILLDLGAARQVVSEVAQALTVMVKPGYAPIEQYADDGNVKQGPWTDIYALGAVIFYAIRGTPPPQAASRLLSDSIPILADLKPEGFSQNFLCAIDAALRVRPEHRPQSVTEFGKLLRGEVEPLVEWAEATPVEIQANNVEPKNLELNQVELNKNEHNKNKLRDVEFSKVDAEQTIVIPRSPTKAPTRTELSPEAPISLIDTQPNSGAKKGVLIGGVLALGVAAAIGWSMLKPKGSEPPESKQSPVAVIAPPAAAEPAASPQVVPAVPIDAAAPVVSTTPIETPTPSVTPDADKPSAVRFAIQPWGEVFVNGVSKGVSPPMKSLSLPPGEYEIEIRNTDFPSHKLKASLANGKSFRVNFSFGDAAGDPAKKP